jgi:phosphotriesterase-related protein
MKRRAFLAAAAGAPFALAQRLRGSVLVHEHVLVDFGGARVASPDRYDTDEVFRTVRPRIEAIAALGCRRFLECTPNFLGRDPRLLARLSDAAGVEIWTNTGLYAASNHRYLPDFARTESAAALARRWIGEVEGGVDGVKPKFIKIGVNNGPLHELDRKVVEAAAMASRETGLTIAAHTGDGKAALEELEILTALKVAPSRFVWVHAQNEKDPAIHSRVASAGAWVEFDGISAKSAAWHVQCIRQMAGQNLLHRVLISQDAGWYHVGEPGGGDFRDYTYIYTDFLPRLDPEWARRLLAVNPFQAFQ